MPTSHTGRPRICVTIGDPKGIGPEIIKKALENEALKGKADFLIIGSEDSGYKNERLCARDSVKFLDTAVRLILEKKADAIVTGPINKEAINKAGIRFQGHTEYLAGLCKCKRFAMMFVSKKLKVSLVTRHIPLSKVSSSLSVKMICDATELTYNALKRYFGIRDPKIGVSGLNPHCSEGGLFGKEERSVIIPAVNRLQKRFKGVFGPVPADSLLYDTYHRKFDAAVCMYHDQALAAFKMIARDEGVNLTLGLPFARTSPDHGTGRDIAHKGVARAGSMIEAIKLAIRLSRPC